MLIKAFIRPELEKWEKQTREIYTIGKTDKIKVPEIPEKSGFL
jgi:hypothetical protein